MARSRRRPDLIVILIDDLRFDEVGFCGHPYLKTPHIDRIGREGVCFENAFHTTPLCSPNRASIVTGQYASRHGVIDNVARDALSHRLPNYHLILQRLGYETAHVGKWHMGNSADPRPGYDHWVSFPGHGAIVDPVLNENGVQSKHTGYITDLLNERALAFVERPRDRPYALFLAHKAVHPDAFQAPDGTLDPRGAGYIPAERHKDLYRGETFAPRPNVMAPGDAVKAKPAFAEAFGLREAPAGRKVMDWIQSGSQEEIRLRAAMMASVDEGVGQLFEALERRGTLDDTLILFLGDNGYFFGEHGLGPSGASPTRKGSARRSWSVTRDASSRGALPGRWCWRSTSPPRWWRWPAGARATWSGCRVARCCRWGAAAPACRGGARSCASTSPRTRCPGCTA